MSTADNIHDNNGSLLTGTAVRIRKTKGPWADDTWVTSPLTGGETACQFPITYQIDDLNNFNMVATSAPELECFGDVQVFSFPTVSASAKKCKTAITSFSGLTNTNFFNLTESLVKCKIFQQEYPQVEPIGGIWPGNLDNITIYPIDKEGETQTINKSDLFGPNGEFIAPTITLGPGLYCAGLTFSDNSYLPLIKEVEDKLVSSVTLSEFVDVNAFPNPFTSDEYEVTISSDAKVKFKYVVTDFNGNIMYEKNFVVQQDNTSNHTIKLKGNVSNGTYYNSLQFEDGSIKSFTVIKQ